MVTLAHLSVREEEEGAVPLLLSEEEGGVSPAQHRPKVTEFFISRGNNLTLSLVLLLGLYSSLLVPAFLPEHSSLLTNTSLTQRDAALLKRSEVLLSSPCQAGVSAEQLEALGRPVRLRNIPAFLHNGTGLWDHPPPLGLRGSEGAADRTLRSLPEAGPPRGPPCRRCVVVGSGGVLRGKRLGPHIDRHDIIIRMNNAPVRGFERHVGSRTTIRLMYPEGAPWVGLEYQNTEIVALVAFKQLDLEWLTSIVTRRPLSWWSRLWFWRNVVEEIPLQPQNFRILNPEIMQQSDRLLQSHTQPPRKMVPTLGLGAVVLALHLCDEVSLAGFGYDLQHPSALLHYYETLRMDAMATQVVHDVSAETILLRELVSGGVVNDLTGAL